LTHPTQNCEIVDSCAGDSKKCYLAGEVSLQVHNETVFTANRSTSEAAIRSGLAAALKVPSKNVAVLQVSGWDFNFPPNLAKLASAAGIEPECEEATDGGGMCGAQSQCQYNEEYGGCFDENEEYCDCPEDGGDDEGSDARRLQAGTELQDLYQNTSVVTGGRALVKWAVSEPPTRLTPGFLRTRRQSLRNRMNRAFQVGKNGSAPNVISGVTFFQPGTFSQRQYGEALVNAQQAVPHDGYSDENNHGSGVQPEDSDHSSPAGLNTTSAPPFDP